MRTNNKCASAVILILYDIIPKSIRSILWKVLIVEYAIFVKHIITFDFESKHKTPSWPQYLIADIHCRRTRTILPFICMHLQKICKYKGESSSVKTRHHPEVWPHAIAAYDRMNGATQWHIRCSEILWRHHWCNISQNKLWRFCCLYWWMI